MRTFSSSRAETSSCPVSSDAVSHSGHRFHLTEFGAARRPFDERGGKADLPHAANDALEAPPASEPHHRVDIVRYAAVDDVGRVSWPDARRHRPGRRQVLLEDCHYDRETGQLLAASFIDYAMPRADLLPALATALSEVPAPSNRLGVRSGGEGGTTPALAAVTNAIVDALSELGVRHIEMPATSERVWRAIRDSRCR